MKTSELMGSALDWAVATCKGITFQIRRTTSAAEEKRGIRNHAVEFNQTYNNHGLERWSRYSPSTDWSQGGPIIEREGIRLDQDFETKEWFGITCKGNDEWIGGPTPLIAAMRCFCASKLGDEIEIPEELV